MIFPMRWAFVHPSQPPDPTRLGHQFDTLPTKNYAHSMHPDLQIVIEAWPHLSDTIKRRIIELSSIPGEQTAC
jgi:hypothetical protein